MSVGSGLLCKLKKCGKSITARVAVTDGNGRAHNLTLFNDAITTLVEGVDGEGDVKHKMLQATEHILMLGISFRLKKFNYSCICLTPLCLTVKNDYYILCARPIITMQCTAAAFS